MTLEELAGMLEETGFPFAYDHFAEGESPDPPFICYLLPGSDNFSVIGHHIITPCNYIANQNHQKRDTGNT